MAQQNLNIGAAPNDGTGDDQRTAATKIQSNFDELYGLLPAEPGATADQTGAEIKTAYEAEPNTNAFTDAEKTKLAGLEASLFKGNYVNLTALQTAHPSPEVGAYAYVDPGVGTDVVLYIWDDDDTAWVQSGGSGTAETPASVKSKYESNADTNAFTDSDKTKLDGITDVPDPASGQFSIFNTVIGDIDYSTSLVGLSISGTTITVDLRSVAGLTGTPTAAQLRTALNVADGAVTAAEARQAEVEEQTATSYTLVAADSGKTKRHNNAAAITVTIPANATDALAIGHTSNHMQYGAGAVTITAASGVTLNGVVAGSGAIQTRYRGLVTLTKIATNEWLIFGDIDAVT